MKFIEKSNDTRHEYDLSAKKGVRGKYADAYKAGYAVRIYDEKNW